MKFEYLHSKTLCPSQYPGLKTNNNTKLENVIDMLRCTVVKRL